MFFKQVMNYTAIYLAVLGLVMVLFAIVQSLMG